MDKKRFVVNQDGTVTDTKTGLTWQRATAGPMTWQEAQEYCAQLQLAGGGWRQPTSHELYSLLDYTRYDPAIDTAVFSNTKLSYYWSSTTNASDTGYAWCVDFIYGYIYSYVKSSSYYVRAVRGGQSRSLDDLIINAD